MHFMVNPTTASALFRLVESLPQRPARALALSVFLLLAAPAGAQQAQEAQEAATLNLNNADIRVLINTVSEATGKNFIVDPRVKAKVTVVSSKSMNKDEIYEVFLSILDVHGFSAVPGDGVTKIVPDVNAKQGAVPTGEDQTLDTSDQLITRVLTLENIAANQLVPILRPLVPQQGHLAAYAPTNVLVITDRASNISRLVKIIRRMDKAESQEIDVVKLENASANELVRIVMSLVQQQQQDNKGPGGRPILAADERTNSILIAGDDKMRQRIKGIIAELDTPLTSTGNTKVIFLEYANAADLVSIIQGVSAKTAEEQQKGQSGDQNQLGVDIQADENNNALVITGQPSMIQELEAVVRQLDIPRAQVLIEAIIAEVSTDLASELGSHFAVDTSNSGEGPVGAGTFPNQDSTLGNLGDSGGGENNTGSAAAAILQNSGLTLGFGDTNGNGTRFGFILRALQGDATTNILSTPTLVTMDNVESEIVFGQNVPFVTGSFSQTGGGSTAGNPFQTIQREDVGLTLKIKPQINEGDAVKLEIEQEISNLTSSAVAASDVVTNKRSIKTQVLVDDGQTIVLGGLIEDEFTDTRQKVPLLGSIPVLGRLFSYTKTQKIKRNLMVFIRPVILKDNLNVDYFTSQKYSLLKSRQLEANIRDRGLINDPAAELPEIEMLFTPLPENSSRPQESTQQQPFDNAVDDTAGDEQQRN